MNRQKAELALLFNVVIWGATFVLVKSALRDISPVLFLAIRFSLATLALAVLFSSHFRDRWKWRRRITVKTIAAGVLPTTLTKTGAGTLAVTGTGGVTLDNSSVVANAGLMDLSNTRLTATARATQNGLQGRLLVNTLIDPLLTCSAAASSLAD